MKKGKRNSKKKQLKQYRGYQIDSYLEDRFQVIIEDDGVEEMYSFDHLGAYAK